MAQTVTRDFELEATAVMFMLTQHLTDVIMLKGVREMFLS